MGKLLSLLARDDSNCCTPKTYDVFLDFENAAPTETEREIYDEVERVLRESDAVLDEIQCYKVMDDDVTIGAMFKWVYYLLMAGVRCHLSRHNEWKNTGVVSRHMFHQALIWFGRCILRCDHFVSF